MPFMDKRDRERYSRIYDEVRKLGTPWNTSILKEMDDFDEKDNVSKVSDELDSFEKSIEILRGRKQAYINSLNAENDKLLNNYLGNIIASAKSLASDEARQIEEEAEVLLEQYITIYDVKDADEYVADIQDKADSLKVKLDNLLNKAAPVTDEEYYYYKRKFESECDEAQPE